MMKIKEEDLTSAHLYFRKLESLYFLYIAAPLAIFIYTYFVNNKPNQAPPQEMNIPGWILAVVLVVSVLLLFLAYKNFKKQVAKINNQLEGVKPKMLAYYGVNARYYLLVELIALFYSIMYWETNIPVFAVFYGLHLAFISWERNTPQRMCRHLKFNKEIYDKIRKGEVL